jgi:hypothetical protein
MGATHYPVGDTGFGLTAAAAYEEEVFVVWVEFSCPYCPETEVELRAHNRWCHVANSTSCLVSWKCRDRGYSVGRSERDSLRFIKVQCRPS